MKRVTTIAAGLILAGALTACGGNDNTNEEVEGSNNVNNNEEVNEMTQDNVDWYIEEYGEYAKITDIDPFDLYDLSEEEAELFFSKDELKNFEKVAKEPHEAMLEDDGMEYFLADNANGQLDLFEIRGYYESENMEDDGTIDTDIMIRDHVESDEETFDYKFSVVLAEATEFEEGGQYLAFLGGQENNTEVRAGTDHDVNVIIRDIKEEADSAGGEGLDEMLEPEFDSEGYHMIEVESDETPEELEVTLGRALEEDGEVNGSDDEYIDFEFNLDGLEVEEETDSNPNDNNEEEAKNRNSNSEEESANEADEAETEDDREGLTVENIKEGMGEDTNIHDLYVEDLRRLSDDELRRLMSEEEVETFDKGEQVYAETAHEDIFMGFGTSEVDDEDLNLTVEDGETVEIEGSVMEPTPYIEKLKEKYGGTVTMDELTVEESDRLDMYEATYLMELEDSQ